MSQSHALHGASLGRAVANAVCANPKQADQVFCAFKCRVVQMGQFEDPDRERPRSSSPYRKGRRYPSAV